VILLLYWQNEDTHN